jgi:hypothetical protein
VEGGGGCVFKIVENMFCFSNDFGKDPELVFQKCKFSAFPPKLHFLGDASA